MRIVSLTLAVAALALAGCDSVTDSIQSRLSSSPSHSRVFHGTAQSVSSAVVLAFKRLDFDVSSPNDASDQIEASGHIQQSEGVSGSRQMVADVRLQDAGPGEVEVQVVLKEQTDDGTPTGRSEKVLRQHGFYNTLFDTIGQVLTETYAPAASPEPAPPHSGRE